MEKSKNNTLFYLMGFLGETIIFVGYYFILTPTGRTNVSWMNWAVISVIFALNYFGVSMMFTSREKFSEKIPGLGLVDYICIIYSIMALIIMYESQKIQLSFRYQLFIHIVLFFFVGIGFMIVMNAIRFVKSHTDYELALQSRIETIRQELNQICSRLTNKTIAESAKIRLTNLQESFRYTSPVERSEAFVLEDQILEVISELKLTESQGLWDIENNNPAIELLLDKLESLYNQRKILINYKEEK